MTPNNTSKLDDRLERRWRRRLSACSSKKPSRECVDDEQQQQQQNSNRQEDLCLHLDSDSDFTLNRENPTKKPPEVVDDDDDNGDVREQQTSDNVVVVDNNGYVGEKRTRDENDVVDPDYKFFLDNLRVCGKSYVLELAGIVVHYEEETTHEQEEEVVDFANNAEDDDDMMVDKDYAKFLGWIEEGEPIISNVSDCGDDDHDGYAENREEVTEEDVDHGMDGNDSVMVDKDYTKFLDWIEEKEEEAESSVECVANFGSKTAEDWIEDEEVEAGCNVESVANFGSKTAEDWIEEEGEEAAGECVANAGSQTAEDKDGNNLGLADDELKVGAHENGERKIADDQDEHADDTSCYIIEQESRPDSFVDVDSGPFIVKTSKFREKLMEILKKPYDEKEYIAMKREISVKKRMERHRELRNNTLKSYPIDRLGNSYLDNYPGVEKKLQEATHSKSRALNVMRGFFYWLKNLTQEGAFPPWLDKSCLEVGAQ